MKGIRKSTFREIKSSLGRFMAIFAIIALGVGFFSGLKVTKDAMVFTVKEYLDSHGFYDFRFLSTLGFEEENVQAFAKQEDVEAAEGAVSMDVIYRLENGEQGVVKACSLPETLNRVELVHGRLPVNSGQCVVDSDFFDESAIGSVIYIAEENEEDTLEGFTHRAYTVVGTVQSPLYIQFERGSTSLGTGRIDGFVYLLPEGFALDYYTEIYVRFAQDNPLYGEGYRNYIDEKKSIWEELAQQQAERRYQSVLAKGAQEIADGEKELAEQRAEGEAELADAAAELEDARQQLADGEAALADAGRELEEGRKTLEEKRQQLADAKEALPRKERELERGEEELAKGESELAENRDRLKAGRAELELGKLQLTSGVAELEMRSGELETQAARLALAYRTGLLAEADYAAAMAQITDYRRQISEGWASLNAARAQIDASESRLRQGEEELAEGERQLQEAEQQLADGRKALEEAKKTIAEGEVQLQEAEKELAEAETALAEKEGELADARQELAEGEKEYEEALQEFYEKTEEAETALAEAEEELAVLELPDSYVLGRDTNIGYACFESDSSIVEGIANIFPVFFFVVAAMVCITTMNRMVEEQRTQIGVLKALGYGRGTIMSKYMIYSGLAAVLGCVCGFLLGTWGFPKVIWFAYGLMYSAAPLSYVFDWKLAVISMAVALLCSVGTTWLSCRVELAQVAAQLMRPKAPKAGKRVFLERVPLLWKHLSFLKKVSVRNIFRYKKRLFMMVLGISGCTALLVTGFGIQDSIADVAAQQFSEIQIYDIGVSLRTAVDEDTERELERLQAAGLDSWLGIMETSMDIVTDKGVKSIYLAAGDPSRMGEYLNMHTEGHQAVSYPGFGEGVITHKLAKQYGIQAGDVIYLRDEDMNTLSVTITAVMENYIYNYVYICPETWIQAFGEAPERKTIWLNLGEDADAHEMSAALMKLDQVVNVTVNADTMERIGAMMKSLDLIVLVVILCAGGLAFIVLYNLTNINITERVREIATVKVLGFYKRETASYVFRENILLTVLAILPGLVLGHFLHAFVMNQIQVDMIAFDIHVRPVSFLYSALLTFGFAWLVDRFMGRKLEEISMTESLKSVD
ncbi:MAG: FtsX-like permease family protein [Butyrivibrio sp.]|nr:FtsX-like permease family protein [Acetatifactor muris]MCM1558161.1 FtsX-like permease family protein [Butyrivibrio sp.]